MVMKKKEKIFLTLMKITTVIYLMGFAGMFVGISGCDANVELTSFIMLAIFLPLTVIISIIENKVEGKKLLSGYLN